MRASAHVRLQWRNSATPREGEGNHVSLAKQPTKQSWSRLTVHGSLKTMPRNCTDSARNRRRDPVRVQALVHRRRQTHQARPTVRSARANRAGSLRSRPSSLGLSRTTSSGKSFGFFWYFVLLVFWYSFVAHSSAPQPSFAKQTLPMVLVVIVCTPSTYPGAADACPAASCLGAALLLVY